MEWSIQGRSHQCQACGRGFRNKEILHTLLRDERSAYVRMDVCADCWNTQFAEGANHQRGFVSCWKSHYLPPPPPAPEPIRRETAETLLRKLVERQEPEHAAACFILAVMLERKRLLKVKSETTDGGRRVLIYEHPKTGDVFTIPDPGLQLDQLEAVQRDVAHLLQHGLDTPPSGADAAASPEPAGPPEADPSSAAVTAVDASTGLGDEGKEGPGRPESSATAGDATGQAAAAPGPDDPPRAAAE